MNTLKLTTLTMIIPLGWAMSADAQPQPFKHLNPGPASTCQIERHSAPATAPENVDAARIKRGPGAIGGP